MSINEIAEAYVKLTLKIGQHHEGYVDAYYGPVVWSTELKKTPLAELLNTAQRLEAQVKKIDSEDVEPLRLHFLQTQLTAAVTFIKLLQGEKLSFDQESKALYDAVSPHFTEHDFDQLLVELDQLLPGDGDLNRRLNTYRNDFVIPKDRLSAVFDAAINKSRQLTVAHIDLPEAENFTVEYVSDQVWSAYNWYKGDAYSLIEVNTDFPIYIERAIDLASHEGYPGHHVFNALIEQNLYQGKGWVEYCIYPIYSPMSLLAEGSANYGIEVAFDSETRLEFEQQVLFPLAGLDETKVAQYYQVINLLQKLSYVDNMVARRYLDNEVNAEQAVSLLMKYALVERARAEQRLKFIECNRSYVINYNLGQDMTQAFIERQVENNNAEQRWSVFSDLLANPRSASLL